MKAQFIRVKGVERGIDFDAYYRVSGYAGISFFLLGWAVRHVEPECEGDEWETEPDHDTVVAVMVGDDRRHLVAVEDLTVLAEDAFCRGCGQIGCGCDVRG